jgi:hypothetical protein
MTWDKLADRTTVEKTMAALKANGLGSFFAADREEAGKKFFELLPEGAEVMNMTSTTLETLGIPKEINESGKYDSIRKKLLAMDGKTQRQEMAKLGSAPKWAVGSIHAVTEAGEILIASATGSQVSAYAYGAENVIWVAGTHKIVKNIDEGFKRIYERCLVLENERAQKAYGVKSSVNKIFIIKKEPLAGRINLILIDEALGF